ncbi:MAG: hypothetical protein M1812_000336 [Candelaria pacifica]|nr:MAG: hypothetical protein M1812_000336 [Candelaria pacifica]
MPRRPQATQLQNAFVAALTGVTRARQTATKKRVNIVSSKLCGRYVLSPSPTKPIEDLNTLPTANDVLTKLAPSLKAYNNCDLVELNPGLGLWSSKIHAILKPRTHVLVERDQDVFLPFLRPLLDEPGSRYRLAPNKGLADGHIFYRDHLDVERDLLPLQQILQPEDPEFNQVNKSLLLIANIAQFPVKRVGSIGSVPHLMLHHLISAIRSHSGYQAYGLVRMLIWVLDDEKKVLIPRTVSGRTYSTIQADISTDVQEIAGSQEPKTSHIMREGKIDRESAARVANMVDGLASGGVEATKVTQPHSDGLSSITSQTGKTRKWVEELAVLEKRFDQGLFEKYIDPSLPRAAHRSGKPRNWNLTPEFTRMENLKIDLRGEKKNTEKIAKLLDEEAILEDLGSLISSGTLTQEEKGQQEKRLEELRQRFRSQVEEMPKYTQDRLASAFDDLKAFRRKEPLLMWDRRLFEPRAVEDDEFYPNQKLALLDFQPRPLSPILRLSPKLFALFGYIVGNLFIQSRQSITYGLNRLAPGAAEALIPEVPALTDPLRGGRRDIEELRVRLLTHEMLEGLTLAWDRWVFKPPMEDVMWRTGDRVEQRWEIGRYVV